MINLLTIRQTSDILPNFRVKNKRYKPKTDINLLVKAESVYSNGNLEKNVNVSELKKEGICKGYTELPKMIQRSKLRYRSENIPINIDECAKVLKKCLYHKGYHANDYLYNQCKNSEFDGNILLNTTVFFNINGEEYGVYIHKIRVKNVFKIEYSRLLNGYFTEKSLKKRAKLRQSGETFDYFIDSTDIKKFRKNVENIRNAANM